MFKKYDTDRDGFITLSFEEFLTGEFFFGGENSTSLGGWSVFLSL